MKTVKLKDENPPPCILYVFPKKKKTFVHHCGYICSQFSIILKLEPFIIYQTVIESWTTIDKKDYLKIKRSPATTLYD